MWPSTSASRATLRTVFAGFSQASVPRCGALYSCSMTVLVAPPGGPSPAGGSRIVSTRLLFMAHKTSAPGGTVNVQVSEQLPTPCIITGFTWSTSTTAAAVRTWTAALFLANNDSYNYDPATLGTRLTSHRDAGASPPDPDVANPLEVSKAWPNMEVWIPLWIPVYQTPSFIKSAARQSAAAAIVYWFTFGISLLDRAPEEPGVGIIPRGTPEEPVCVRICGAEAGAAPTGAAPAPGVPSPPATPARGPTIDVLALPFPAFCPLNPDAPLQSAAGVCEVP